MSFTAACDAGECEDCDGILVVDEADGTAETFNCKCECHS